jgi:hypothetical protein
VLQQSATFRLHAFGAWLATCLGPGLENARKSAVDSGVSRRMAVVTVSVQAFGTGRNSVLLSDLGPRGTESLHTMAWRGLFRCPLDKPVYPLIFDCGPLGVLLRPCRDPPAWSVCDGQTQVTASPDVCGASEGEA